MKSSLFPDVNVWLALTHERHAHHATARRWLDSEHDPQLYFCRFTQLGLLRLLTNEQVMAEDVLSQRKAWQTYRRWLEDSRINFHREPESAEFESLFEDLSTRSYPATKLWADAYLAAFAKSSGLTLVTFDRALERTKQVSIRILSPG
jgi:uncharacterized protein